MGEDYERDSLEAEARMLRRRLAWLPLFDELLLDPR